MTISVNGAQNLSQYQNVRSNPTFKNQSVPVNMEQQSDTFEKQGMSNGKKVAITIGSIGALLLAVFGIKKYLNKAVKFGVNEIKNIINNSNNEAVSAIIVKRCEKNSSLFENIDKKFDYLLVMKKADGKITKSAIKGKPTDEIATLIKDKNGTITSDNIIGNELFM